MDNESAADNVGVPCHRFQCPAPRGLDFQLPSIRGASHPEFASLSVLSCIGVRKLLFITNDLLASFCNINPLKTMNESEATYIATRYIVSKNRRSPDLVAGFRAAALAVHGRA